MNDHRRKRASKWDIGTEAPGNLVPDIGQQNPLLLKANRLLNHKESGLDRNSVAHNVNRISNQPDLEHEGNSKVGQVLKRNRVDEFSKVSKSTKQSNIEAGYGDDNKKSYQEATAENQTGGKENVGADRELDGFGTSPDLVHRRSMSPNVDKWRRRSMSISPIGGRNKSRWSRSSSNGRSRSCSRSQSRSRSRSWSRSPPYVSKHGSERWVGRGRSRSPLHGSRHGSERWTGRDRMVSKGSAEPCRDFAAGRCRRGSQCRYLHDDGRRQYDNCSGRGTLEMGDSKSGRGRYESHYGKDNATGPVEERDYSHDKGRWHGNNHQTDDRMKVEPNRNNRSTERCYNFTKGRCNKGSMCRYVHHTAASEARVHTEDESRDKSHGGRDAEYSFRPRLERPRLSDTPCKFFAEGRCHRGEDCRFSHEGMVNVNSEEQPSDNALGQDAISLDVPNWIGKTTAICLTNPTQGMHDDGGGKEVVTVEAIMSKELLKDGVHHPKKTYPVENKWENLSKETRKVPIAPQGQNATPVTSEQHQQFSVAPTQSMSEDSLVQQQSDKNCEMPTIDAVSSVVTPSSRNTLGQTGPNRHVVSQPLIGQNFHPNPQLQQISSMLASSGQRQQINTPLTLNQLAGLQAPSASQNFNSSIRSQGFLPSPLNGQVLQNPMFGMQNQQNLQILQNHQIQKLNLSGQIQPGLLTPFTGHSQQNMNLSQQIQQGAPLQPHLGHGQVNVNPLVPNQPIISPTNSGQNQQNFDASKHSQQSLPALLNGQFQLPLSSLGPSKQNEPHQQNPQGLESNEQNNQAQTNGEEVIQKADPSTKPSQLGPDANVNSKLVTSEQAAQISNLSASLAQFFGSGQNLPQLYATLNPLTTVGPAPGQPSPGPYNVKPLASAGITAIQPGQGSLVHQYQNPVPNCTEPAKPGESNHPPGFPANSFENKDPRLKDSQTRTPITLIGASHGGDLPQGLPAAEPAEVIGDNEVKEVNQTETGQSKKEQVAQSGDVDPETRTDGESKKSKEAKAMRMFKCALVEFVKDILKPHWKDGVISKEAHKTIVKKVVEKVTGVMQGASIPQTPEKIETYMSHSKAKLNKLVQAYVDKYA